MTDEEIGVIVTERKRPTSKPRQRAKPGHVEVDCRLEGESGAAYVLWVRRSLLESDDYTAGLRLCRPGEPDLILRRHNGSSHIHRNNVEKTEFEPQCHIHQATARYIEDRRQPDGFAETTPRYNDLWGAVETCLRDCGVEGLGAAELLPDEQQIALDLLEREDE